MSKINHLDSTKTTYLCPMCDAPYFQIDRAEWGQSPDKWDRKAKKFHRKNHVCWWRKRKQPDLKQEKREEQYRETKQAMEENK